MYTRDAYPTTVATHTSTYPIERVAASYVLDEAEVTLRSDGTLWMLQQAVGRARFEMLEKLIESDMVTIPGRDSVTIEVRIVRSCVSVEAGDVGAMPQDTHYVTTFAHFGDTCS